MTLFMLETHLDREVARARPVVERVVARYRQRALRQDDAEDIVSTVMLRLVRRLQAAAVESVTDYAATLAFNAIYDFMRRRHPEWTRLKNRLRYILTRDARFRMWSAPAGVLCALAEVDVAARPVPVAPVTLSGTETFADVVSMVLAASRGAVIVDDVVGYLAGESSLREVPRLDADVGQCIDPGQDLERREYLERLWREIQELHVRHRAALLLNLRDADGGNALALLVHLHIATVGEIANAIAVPLARLSQIWSELPLDDHRIATMLEMNRQQVINLRRTARERLARRMKAAS